MSAAPAKFMFDHDFTPSPGGRSASISVAEHAIKLKEAEAAGYGRGVADAEAAAKADADRCAAAALERIAVAVEGLARSLDTVEARLETEAIEVAVAVARKLAPQLIAREPLAEIAALATECFRHLVAMPHVVVRVNDALHAAAREELGKIMSARGLDSRLVVLADPDIAAGDCRVEWADGGITRDSAAIGHAIEQAVARYVSARKATAGISGNSWRSDDE